MYLYLHMLPFWPLWQMSLLSRALTRLAFLERVGTTSEAWAWRINPWQSVAQAIRKFVGPQKHVATWTDFKGRVQRWISGCRRCPRCWDSHVNSSPPQLWWICLFRMQCAAIIKDLWKPSVCPLLSANKACLQGLGEKALRGAKPPVNSFAELGDELLIKLKKWPVRKQDVYLLALL